MILPTQIREVLSSNEISQIQLKDGTIIRITDSNIPQYNIASQEVQQSSSMNSVELEEKEGGHNHHKGMGYFGHHFKTQYYNNLCADCMTGGGVVKKRKNYVLYVSKNCTENDVALKHKLRKSEKQQIQENIQTVQEQIKENIEEQIKENIEEEIKEQEQIPVQVEENQIEQKENEEQIKNNEGQPEEIIMEGYVESNDVPILEEKIILRKDSNNKQENLCNECKNETKNINNIETNENICNECKEEINTENNEQQQNNIEHINNEEVNVEENNMNNIQSNEEGEEMNEMEQQNNEIGEEENICDDGMNQNEQQNEGNEEQKLTKTVEVLIPENQNEN